MGDTSGLQLRKTREDAGITQQEVADALQVSRQTVVTWEGKAIVSPAKAERYLRVVSELARKGEAR